MKTEHKDMATAHQTNETGAAQSWIMVLAIALFFFLWGLLIYFSVGDTWPPAWHYGTVPDVPGQSVYSVQGSGKRAATAPLAEDKNREQHIMGPSNETGRPRDRKGL